MTYPPAPRYTDGMEAGVLQRDQRDPVGRTFSQPTVVAGGQRLPLDDALGSWFAVLCLDDDPATLDRDALAWWGSIGARLVCVRPSDAAAAPLPGSGEVLVVDDVDDALREWWRSRPEREVIVVRPD